METLGIQGLSKSQVSELAKTLDAEVAAFRGRPLDAGPYAYVWVDALVVKCREAGRIVNVAGVLATGVGADGHREILGVDVLTSEDGAGWTAFCVNWSPVASRVWSWWSPTPMPGSRRRSRRAPLPAQLGDPEGKKRSATEIEADEVGASLKCATAKMDGPASAATATAPKGGSGGPNAAATSTTRPLLSHASHGALGQPGAVSFRRNWRSLVRRELACSLLTWRSLDCARCPLP